ncbi:MAG: AraC family ligand binding domain-containing protein [Xanthobacteraceae bacterium]
MSLTFIDTNKLSKKPTAGQGEVTEILSEALCGAHNVHGSIRWLKSGESFNPQSIDRHQLIYLMEGRGSIRLDAGSYDVERGAGVYLGLRETATIQPAGGSSLKLFHLIVPQIPK